MVNSKWSVRQTGGQSVRGAVVDEAGSSEIAEHRRICVWCDIIRLPGYHLTFMTRLQVGPYHVPSHHSPFTSSNRTPSRFLSRSFSPFTIYHLPFTISGPSHHSPFTIYHSPVVRLTKKTLCTYSEIPLAGRSSNGRTADSESAYRGSNPCLPAKRYQ